ncbi:hypothetical protein [Polynucleobacter necessarius]|uniref:hypothetical protein n=1 Tax=Polynucleobacter necessarius TaxID=576610 RepID=UPI001E5EC9A3|nr:hypothetical protein [Polynucleobacter necessarius]
MIKEVSSMRLNKFILLWCVGASLLVLSGCASKAPLAKAEPEVVGQVPADSPKNPVISADTLKAESKSIAVTDIYFKKEGKNLTYIEETKTTSDSSSSSASSPKMVEVAQDKANASALTGGPNSSAFPVKFTNLADQKSNSSDVSANNAGSANTQNTQTQKKSGYQSSVEYGELRYLANPIRGLLIKSGYKVVQAKSSLPAAN